MLKTRLQTNTFLLHFSPFQDILRLFFFFDIFGPPPPKKTKKTSQIPSLVFKTTVHIEASKLRAHFFLGGGGCILSLKLQNTLIQFVFQSYTK
jgi:hypothetical protein